MRTLLSLSTFAVLAACSDDRAVTAPAAAGGSLPPAVVDARASSGVVGLAAAKPMFTSIFTVVGQTRQVLGDPGNQGATSTAACPTGSVAIGGAFSISSGGKDVRILASKPNETQTAWLVFGAWFGDDFNGTNYGEFTATAICVK